MDQKTANYLLSGCCSGEENLIIVEHSIIDMEIYEIVLEPDMTIETFYIEYEDHATLLTSLASHSFMTSISCLDHRSYREHWWN